MIVDIHTHLWEQPEQLGPGSAQRLRQFSDKVLQNAEAPLAGYDQAMEPVDHAVILGFESLYLGGSIPHEQVARYVARNPEKYLGFAGIDPMGPSCLDSLQHARSLGLAGVTISPAAQNFHPAHTRAMALYEQCEKLDIPVLVHPGTHLAIDAAMEFSQPHLWDEVGRSFPQLRLVLAQVGHPWTDAALMLISKHHRFYADLSDVVARPWQLYNVLLSAFQQNVIDRLLLGSDYPFMPPQAAAVNVFSVNTLTQGTHLPTIPREKLRSIVERNALECLGLKPKAAANQQADDQPAEPTQHAAPKADAQPPADPPRPATTPAPADSQKAPPRHDA